MRDAAARGRLALALRRRLTRGRGRLLAAGLASASALAITGSGATGFGPAAAQLGPGPTAAQGAQPDMPATGAAVPTACPTGDPGSPQQLRRDVRWLASGDRGGRAPGSAGDRQTRRFIAARFRCLGLAPAGRDGGYQSRFRTSEGDPTGNVIAYLPAADAARRSEATVLGAHHDHIGRRGGRIYRGANDNASGTAGLLAVAAELSRRPEPLPRPVILVAFGGEETLESAPFLEGSVRFVRRPPLDFHRRDFGFMVNLDMLGTYRDRRAALIFGPRRGDPAHRLIEELRPRPRKQLRLRFPGDPSRASSDFWPFARRGIPYAFFHTPDGPCLHRFCDVPGRLDYRPMARIVQLAADTVVALAEQP